MENPDFLSELINQAKRGQNGAFGQIYDLYFKKIYRFIYFRVGHKETAEDLTEDVFIKVHDKIFSVNKPETFTAWLYQIARNKVVDYYRDKKITVGLDEVENTLEYETNIIDVVNLTQQQQTLLKILKDLTAEQQTVVKLKFFEDLSNQEIARILNKNEGSIRVIQHRAITKLQELIKKTHEG